MKELYKTQVVHIFGNEPEETREFESVQAAEIPKEKPKVIALF